MGEILQRIETANEEDKNKDLFSEVDINKFTELVKNEADFKILLNWLSSNETLQNIHGLKNTIDTEIKKPQNKNKGEIFTTGYTKSFTEEQDLYEICVLWAILQNETDKVASPDYKFLAKQYYERLWWATSTPEVQEAQQEKIINGKYKTAEATISDDKIITKINETTTIEAGQTITGADITISAGADRISWKNNEKAKTIYTDKIAKLKEIREKFTDKNKVEVDKIIAELQDTKKINEISTNKIDNQEGNRYIIGARVAEGFIKALENITENDKLKLTLGIDRANCTIGERKESTEDDRFVKIDIKVTKENSVTANKDKAQPENTQGKTETTNTQRSGDVTTTTGGQNEWATRVIPGSEWQEKTWKQQQEIKIEVKESAETLQVKHDIADHFKLQGKEFAPQEVSDVVQDPKNPKKYTATIKGYTDFSINYGEDTIEITQWVVKKWLLKWNIKEGQSVKIDRVSEDRSIIKKDLTLEFNAAESKKYINSKLLSTTTGDQGKYEVKNDTDITESTIHVEYTNSKIIKPANDGKAISDQIIISLDSEYMINKWKDTSIPLERQKVWWETEKINCNKPYKIDDDTTKISYYAKTSWGKKDPSIHIINNITNVEEDVNGNVTEVPLFSEYTNIIKQDRTVEEYTKKIMLGYDTPAITSIEKQFQNTASVEYTNQNYSITTTFEIPGKKALTLTLPISYQEWNTKNQNTSSIVYDKTPTLTWTDEYNKVQEWGNIMIDGIVYYIGVANQQQKNMPTIIFRHREDKTLENAKERTKGYKIESNVFGIKNANDQTQEGYTRVNTWFGNCEYGPLTIKDGDWSDPISYYKDIYVGQVKDENRILLQGTKVGSMYFDQHGKFLEYKTNKQQMTFETQTDKVDLKDNTPIGIQEPLGKTGKNILLTQSLVGTTLNVDIMDADDTYVGTKTGTDFVKTQDEEKAKNIDEHFYTSRETKLMIAKSRITIYEGLKKISSDDINEKSQNLFNFITETDKEPNIVLGPDWKWVYAYKLIKADGEYPPQYIYCKVNNKKISLCNANGEILEQQKIFLKSNNDYYNIKINDEQTEFEITGKEKEAQTKVPKIESDIDKNYKTYTGDLNEDRYCGYWSAIEEDKNSYQFMCGKYTSCEVEINWETIEGKDKIDDLSTFSLVDENQEGFGSYKDFFTTPYQENLGIDEKIYKEVFSTVLQEKETNTDNLVRVKYEKDGKFYYAPMYLEINKKWEKNVFDITLSQWWKEAIKETEKRLNNLVKSYSIFLEQDITTDKTKGDILQWWYLVKPTSQSANEYFKDPTQNISLSLQTNNKIGGEYQKETIIFDPARQNIEPKEIVFSGITYGLSIKMDDKMGYKIIVKKGQVSE